ncbi:peptidase M23 [Dyadobacter frigoris]|uniref:M23 family metallopeptidase n=1 Tax=Dyadobacter frigoris TaxID=2576211 RepID=UPI0024A550F2|nr:M23 family metallopeptidase [Dyadobacter frigoris]GLU55571.1 peptidase M23 [Dyadobacter frigoris]
MKLFFILISNLLCFSAFAQQEIRVFFEKKNNGYILYADNNAFCPVTMSLDLNLVNFSFSKGEKKIFVIPQKTEKFLLGELDVIYPAMPNKFSYNYLFSLGNIYNIRYDEAYEYDLPFLKNKDYYLVQGYHGSFSHQNDNALDFIMAEGTEIAAVREGVVVKVVQSNTESCLREECKKMHNYILIYHSDGTIANYSHLMQNGSKVSAGDIVKKGQVIGLSGNTGFSSGPHLHLSCSLLLGIEKYQTVRTKFRIGDGNNSEYLQEKCLYMKGY